MPAAVLILLGALTAVGPIALDLYLSAFPQIAAELGTTPTQVQLTLTACMIGLAVGQLVSGIASDALGRKRPLLVGMAFFFGFSLLCMLSQSIWMLIVARFLQGVGGGAGIVIARAVIRDRTTGCWHGGSPRTPGSACPSVGSRSRAASSCSPPPWTERRSGW
ncbi:MFS transporter [Blastococcus sp. Marseille-P5729]|uniref:MFS transporter n=1 Tax=Blastococcus sp. Marseille-P5729 TaxID=2086582 RepID=UPI000D1121C6|nr:MFS transporter [Blastococcus sp. Marseille-P5729]